MTQKFMHTNLALDRFFEDRQGCEILRQDVYKTLLRVKHEDQNSQDWFIKIYHYPKLLRFRIVDWRFVGGATEFRICEKLRSLGVVTPEPIGFATDGNILGIPKQSLYVSKWLHDCKTLDVVLRDNTIESSIAPEDWASFLIGLGTYIGSIHARKVNPKDLNPKNVLVRWRPGETPHFFLVDYERVVFLSVFDLKKYMTGLSHLGASILPLFDDAIRLFCEGYVSEIPESDLQKLVHKLTTASHQKIKQWRDEVDAIFEAIGDQRKRPAEQDVK